MPKINSEIAEMQIMKIVICHQAFFTFANQLVKTRIAEGRAQSGVQQYGITDIYFSDPTKPEYLGPCKLRGKKDPADNGSRSAWA